jgi:hypothetical protein
MKNGTPGGAPSLAKALNVRPSPDAFDLVQLRTFRPWAQGQCPRPGQWLQSGDHRDPQDNVQMADWRVWRSPP